MLPGISSALEEEKGSVQSMAKLRWYERAVGAALQYLFLVGRIGSFMSDVSVCIFSVSDINSQKCFLQEMKLSSVPEISGALLNVLMSPHFLCLHAVWVWRYRFFVGLSVAFEKQTFWSFELEMRWLSEHTLLWVTLLLGGCVAHCLGRASLPTGSFFNKESQYF